MNRPSRRKSCFKKTSEVIVNQVLKDKTINSKLFWGELELITITDDFFTYKLSCICAHSSIKLTRKVVHFIHRVYYAPEVEQ